MKRLALIAVLMMTTTAAWGLDCSSLPCSEDFDTSDYISEIAFPREGYQTHEWLSTGGWSGGASKWNFIYPGTADENSSGMGGWQFANNGNGPPRLNIRLLQYYGPDYHAAQAEGAKTMMLHRCNTAGSCNNWGNTGERANIIEVLIDGHRFPVICENVGCDYYNFEPGFSQFNIDEHLGEWISYEYELNLTTRVYKLFIDTQDGEYSSNGGTTPYQTITINDPDPAQWWELGPMPGYWERRNSSGWTQGDAWYLIDEVYIDDSYIGPPAGFVTGSGETGTAPGTTEGLERTDKTSSSTQ